MITLKSTKNVSENIFFKMSQTLSLYTQVPKMGDDSRMGMMLVPMLDAAWKECKDSKEKKELFFSILFSAFDITNREHNIFRKQRIKDVDNGGYSKRRSYVHIINWMQKNVPDQLYRFLPILGEYYHNGGILINEIRTERFKGNVTETLKVNLNEEKVISYVTTVLKSPATTGNEMKLWARWLPHIPDTTRRRVYVITDKNVKAFKKGGHDVVVGDKVTVVKKKQAVTQTKNDQIRSFIHKLSLSMGWAVVKNPKGFTDFLGYKKFRSEWMNDTEAHLFSTKKILTYDESQFIDWLNIQPSDARYRVQRRVLNMDKTTKKLVSSGKWKSEKYNYDLGEAYLKWMQMKEKAQKKLREMSKEDKEKLAPKDLKKLETAAKVNVGATDFLTLVQDFLTEGDVQTADLKADQMLKNIKLEVPVLVCNDISGSMSSAAVNYKGKYISRIDIARLITTIMMLKNPSDNPSDFTIAFGSSARVLMGGETALTAGTNRYMSTNTKVVDYLVDRKKPFIENFLNISELLPTPDGSTNIAGIPDMLKKWVESEPAYKQQRIDAINQYPVFLFISDNEFNNMSSPATSMMAFQSQMLQYFGWSGVCVLWDVVASGASQRFEGIPNVIHLGGFNVGVLTQLFKNIHDMDIVDIYLPLKALHASNRYEPVRRLVV